MTGRFKHLARLAALVGLLLQIGGAGLSLALAAAPDAGFDAPICHAAGPAPQTGGDPAGTAPVHDHCHCIACNPAGPVPGPAAFHPRFAAQPVQRVAERAGRPPPAQPCAGFAPRAPPGPMT